MSLTADQLTLLKTELFGGLSPLAATYATIEAGLGDQATKDTALAAAINATDTNRTIIRESLSGRELLEATNSTDFVALTEHKQLLWLAMSSMSDVDPRPGSQGEALAKHIFGVGSDTISNLATARLQTVSRAAELGLPEIRAADVGESRLS